LGVNTTTLFTLEAGFSDRMSDSELWGAFWGAERANDRELTWQGLPNGR
jgi:hypothetical protein